ncbi:hypothetical protein BaRGS_00011185 [Batillaria attramentaria]|uniref:Uncharacterized protein n=1 Tax=Batillaria attramentaria TaxID=370345 RepID=A0ABD0LDX4_9CAEN
MSTGALYLDGPAEEDVNVEPEKKECLSPKKVMLSSSKTDVEHDESPLAFETRRGRPWRRQRWKFKMSFICLLVAVAVRSVELNELRKLCHSRLDLMRVKPRLFIDRRKRHQYLSQFAEHVTNSTPESSAVSYENVHHRSALTEEPSDKVSAAASVAALHEMEWKPETGARPKVRQAFRPEDTVQLQETSRRENEGQDFQPEGSGEQAPDTEEETVDTVNFEHNTQESNAEGFCFAVNIQEPTSTANVREPSCTVNVVHNSSTDNPSDKKGWLYVVCLAEEVRQVKLRRPRWGRGRGLQPKFYRDKHGNHFMLRGRHHRLSDIVEVSSDSSGGIELKSFRRSQPSPAGILKHSSEGAAASPDGSERANSENSPGGKKRVHFYMGDNPKISQFFRSEDDPVLFPSFY